MKLSAINFSDKLALFNDHWAPKVIAEMNDYQFKLVKMRGDFVWHNHPETDEVFMVIAGQLDIEFSDKTVSLNAGEMLVVPKGVNHKPRAHNECSVMLIEPKGVINTGAAESTLTAENDIWL